MNGEAHDPSRPGEPGTPYSSEWDEPAGRTAGWGEGGRGGLAPLPVRRAAVFLWILGGVGVLLWSCAGGTLLWLGLTPRATLDRVLQVQTMRPEQREMLDRLLEYKAEMPVAAGAALVVGLLPAIANVVLAFFVRRKSRAAIIAALVLVGLQTGYLVLQVAGAVAQGAATGLLGAAVMVGPLLVLSAVTLRWLWRALAATKPGQRADADGWQGR